VHTGLAAYGAADCLDQGAGWGQEGVSAQGPGQIVVLDGLKTVRCQNGRDPLLQAFGGGLCGKTEVEVNHHDARNHIASAGASVDVADLKAGGLEKSIALVPDLGCERSERGCGEVDGVAGQLRVGDVALDALDREHAAERATAAVFNH